ncbi:hypothetical protein [Leptolyngbya sp. FACHB-261]|uniref:hypothetical protein n=1 Tax=Leptolyngbya sp. FACHB-261 TaxID=2692806 RepID=UPI001688E6DF|nr:hypothetical protein [Leptolyngbya sp. FACHB-261]MBD2103901.1 hypothetical protein [Leptolyngbya sp. FACHB-261]
MFEKPVPNRLNSEAEMGESQVVPQANGTIRVGEPVSPSLRIGGESRQLEAVIGIETGVPASSGVVSPTVNQGVVEQHVTVQPLSASAVDRDSKVESAFQSVPGAAGGDNENSTSVQNSNWPRFSR